ncbi:LysM peptidoglycan-binding domain-containing protein [Paenisporosarcina indica]|uniref:LysM peptidoglycan-binding domain-containing protein n=1 Tax=Paenisporosarcina indica TaxID=650093 RepID=UPI00095032E1|nr:LysM peptidoglycan-binding domain-containing protein [Paenisporosarcina indica]
MSNLTSKQKEVGLIVLSVLFCLAIVAYSYFTFYSPKKESLAMAETTLATDRQTLFALEQQLADQPEIPLVSSLELQKKVPVEPLTELILLQVEKAEVVSQSMVQSISFAEAPFVIEAPPEGVETLQQLAVSMTIETANFKNLEIFIDELEKLDRILVVESIAFGSPGEITTADQEQDKLSLSLTFSAFFRPDLIELLDEVPKVDTPPPADKVNPLPSNNGIDDGELPPEEAEVESKESATSKEATSVSDSVASVSDTKPKVTTAKPKYRSYTVKRGDTLYSISMKHYGSRTGEEKIKQANGLKSDNVKMNTTLIIPD